MINFMVANVRKEHKKYNQTNVDVMLKSQIENSLDCGWHEDDIIILANFDFEFMGVKTIKWKGNKHCWTGSKMFGVDYLFRNSVRFGVEGQAVWAHDLDCWENHPIDDVIFEDVGIATYSNAKYNGGSVFWKYSAMDIISIIEFLLSEGAEREEPTINRVLKSKKFRDRVTVVDNTYNVGCSGFVKRYNRSTKPIKVLHFNPMNKISWETHALDRNGLGASAISERLEALVRRYYPHLATELATVAA
jgi:hypothetical protein